MCVFVWHWLPLFQKKTLILFTISEHAAWRVVVVVSSFRICWLIVYRIWSKTQDSPPKFYTYWSRLGTSCLCVYLLTVHLPIYSTLMAKSLAPIFCKVAIEGYNVVNGIFLHFFYSIMIHLTLLFKKLQK